MALSPLVHVENFFSAGPGKQFPLHSIAGSEEAGGFEAYHVADGRRSVLDYWTGITPNIQQTLTVTCDRPRGANAAFIDRGHNLASFQVFIEASMDNSTWQVMANPIIPSTPSHGTQLANVNGVATEEGAWGMTFPQGAGLYWRLRIPALGANVLPKVVGFWLGMAYTPFNNFLVPWDEDADTLLTTDTVTEWGWRGSGPIATPNVGAMNMKLLTDDEYDLARYNLAGHYARRRPMWICFDTTQADRMFLAIRPESSQLALSYTRGWFPRSGSIPYIEHEVLRIN